MNTRCKPPVPVGSHLLCGAKEIGEYLGLSARATYYLVDKGRIPPVFRMGGRRIYSQRDALHTWLAEQMRSGHAIGHDSSGSTTAAR